MRVKIKLNETRKRKVGETPRKQRSQSEHESHHKIGREASLFDFNIRDNFEETDI